MKESADMQAEDWVAASDAAAENATRHLRGTGGAEAALVHEVRALRFTIRAALAEPAVDVEVLPEPRWCRVELFGHRVVYARVSETVVAGRRMLRLDEPALSEEIAEGGRRLDGVDARSRTYSPNAVYSLEEIGEDAVRAAHRSQRGSLAGLVLDGGEDDRDDEEPPF